MQMGVYIMELTEKKEFDLLSLGDHAEIITARQ